MAAQTAEQAYAVFEELLRLLTGAHPQSKPTLYALALRASLHPLLSPFREDPSRTLSGQFVSLDARVASLFDESAHSPAAASTFRDFPEDDLWALGELPDIAPQDPAAAAAAVGSFGGALYLPAVGGAISCRARAFFAPGEAPDHCGWEPPTSVREVAPAIQSAAEHALTAALLFLESRGLLPAARLPGVVYYDISGSSLGDDLLTHVSGNSLELPLLSAFLSALTGEAISENIGGTSAIGSAVLGQEISFRQVSHVAEKAATFAAGFADGLAPFIAPTNPEEGPLAGTIAIANLTDIVPYVFPAWVRGERAENAADTNPKAPGEPDVFLSAILGDEEAEALTASNAETWRLLVARAIDRCRGVCRPTDGGKSGPRVLACFPAANNALDAAAAILQTLRFHPWPFGAADPISGSLLPGIGIHRGTNSAGRTTIAADSGPHAARIAEAANPGQVLLSASARAEAADRADNAAIITGASLTAFEPCRLRDLSPPVALWQAEFALDDGRGRRLPARLARLPRSLDNYSHNLPFQLTPTFGREHDVDTIHRLICGRTAASRLVSVVAGGGFGKTRVALEVGAGCLAEFPDGVWLIGLEGGVLIPEDVAVRVGEALPFQLAVDGSASPAGAYLRAVIKALSSLRILLILDGIETPDEGGAVSAFAHAFLAQCASASILVTTRIRLNISEETYYPLTPLTVSDGDEVAASPSPAVDLFYARARFVRPSLALSDPAERRLVAHVCAQLGGLPLAIEIAAAHAGALSLPEIAAEIDSLAAVENRRLPTLQCLFTWAFGLLDAADRTLLCALSVFRDGFGTDAVEAMGEPDFMTDESLRLLEERSLIRTRNGEAGRFDLHSSIREFSRRKLAESGRESEARAQHARYFEAFAARHGADEPNALRERVAFDRLDADLNNLRAAVEFLRSYDPTRVPQMIAHLCNFLRYRGHLQEWRSWPALALRLLPAGIEEPTALFAQVHLYRAAAFADIDCPDDADRHLDIAYPAAMAIREWVIAAKALNLRSVLRSRAARWPEAFAALQEARDLNKRVHSDYGEASALNQLGVIAARQSKNAEAREWLEAAAHLSRAIDDRRGLAIALGSLGYIAIEEKDYATAQSYFEEGLAEGRALQDATRVAHGLLNLGDVRNRQKDWDSGTPLLALAEAMLTRQRHRSLAEAVRCLAEAEPHFDAGRLADLRRQFSRLPLPKLLQLDPTHYTPRRLRLPP